MKKIRKLRLKSHSKLSGKLIAINFDKKFPNNAQKQNLFIAV